MSIRSLIEINHDYAHMIESNPAFFVAALLEHLRAAESLPDEVAPGVYCFGTRHHSDRFKILWGGYMAENP